MNEPLTKQEWMCLLNQLTRDELIELLEFVEGLETAQQTEVEMDGGE